MPKEDDKCETHLKRSIAIARKAFGDMKKLIDKHKAVGEKQGKDADSIWMVKPIIWIG